MTFKPQENVPVNELAGAAGLINQLQSLQLIQSEKIFNTVKEARTLPFQEVMEAESDAKATEDDRARENWVERV